MRAQRYGTGTILLAIILAAFAGHMVGKYQGQAAEYRCGFVRIDGTYLVTGAELAKSDSLIFVRGLDGKRSHAFRRDNLSACQEVTP